MVSRVVSAGARGNRAGNRVLNSSIIVIQYPRVCEYFETRNKSFRRTLHVGKNCGKFSAIIGLSGIRYKYIELCR